MNGNFSDHLIITPKFWNHFGRCFSIRPKEDVRKLGIVDIIFEAKKSMYVYFGHPGQFEAANRNTKVSNPHIVGVKILDKCGGSNAFHC